MIDPLPQVGGDYPPRHPDGDVVLTPRLSESWTPYDEWHYNTEGVEQLVYRKVRQVFWGHAHEERLYDAWSMEDAQSLALELRFQHPEWPDEFVANRVYSRAIDHYRRDEVIDFRELPEDGEDGEDGGVPIWTGSGRGRGNQADNPYVADAFVPQVLSEATWEWVRYHLSTKAAEAVRLWAEEQYTQDEAAKAVGLKRLAVTRAFSKLREQVADQAKDT